MKPLDGVQVIEMAGMPPTSFAGLLLADYGAEVVRVCRPGETGPEPGIGLQRHRSATVEMDLKDSRDVDRLLDLVRGMDVLLESFRPGVCERLGIGPDVCHENNPGLIFARLTGWGQTGPYADRPGHDINYIGLAGVLALLGAPDEPPLPPLNLVGNLAGGALTLVAGVAAALYERTHTGLGCVIDAAMLDGAMQLSAGLHAARYDGRWRDERRANLTDGGCPFYRCYRTSDDRHVAVAAVEPQFYRALLDLLDLPSQWSSTQHDRSTWPTLTEAFTAAFAQASRQAWCSDVRSSEACVTPVLLPAELASDPHIAARQLVTETRGEQHPVSAPRFDR